MHLKYIPIKRIRQYEEKKRGIKLRKMAPIRGVLCRKIQPKSKLNIPHMSGSGTISFIRIIIPKSCSVQCAFLPCSFSAGPKRRAEIYMPQATHQKDMGHPISSLTLTSRILRVTGYLKCLFLISTILEFLPTSSFDRGPVEDGVES